MKIGQKLTFCFNKMAEDLKAAMEKEKGLASAAVADAERKKAQELAALNEELESTNEELRQTNEELESTTEELRVANEEAQKEKEAAQKKAEQLERFNKVAVDRELKMKELKERIAELEKNKY